MACVETQMSALCLQDENSSSVKEVSCSRNVILSATVTAPESSSSSSNGEPSNAAPSQGNESPTLSQASDAPFISETESNPLPPASSGKGSSLLQRRGAFALPLQVSTKPPEGLTGGVRGSYSRPGPKTFQAVERKIDMVESRRARSPAPAIPKSPSSYFGVNPPRFPPPPMSLSSIAGRPPSPKPAAGSARFLVVKIPKTPDASRSSRTPREGISAFSSTVSGGPRSPLGGIQPAGFSGTFPIAQGNDTTKSSNHSRSQSWGPITSRRTPPRNYEDDEDDEDFGLTPRPRLARSPSVSTSVLQGAADKLKARLEAKGAYAISATIVGSSGSKTAAAGALTIAGSASKSPRP